MGHCAIVFWIALVVNQDMVLQGVINNGDVLRLLADGVSLETPAKEMVREPITASVYANDEQILQTVRSQLFFTGGTKDVTRHVPLVDERGVGA